MSIYNPFASTESYLVPEVIDRLDPLLDTLRPLLPGGPTPFVAMCTMNSLSLSPTVRHLDFLLFAVEIWLDVVRDDPSMWHSLGIGRKVAQWFEKAAEEDMTLFMARPSRTRAH